MRLLIQEIGRKPIFSGTPLSLGYWPGDWSYPAIEARFAEAHLLAGNILLRLNQQQRARAEYEEYLRLAPKGEYAADTRALIQKLKTFDNRQ